MGNGHEHSYARTRTLSEMENEVIDPAWPRADELGVKEGSSFVMVAGLGGFFLRPQFRCLPTTFPYGCNNFWGKILTSDQHVMQNVAFGVVFFDFHVDKNPCKARVKVLSNFGSILDEFTIYSNVAGS